MGKKHSKKRFFCVKYIVKPDKKFDEFVELSKKKIGPGKMQEYTVVLDLINKEVLKNDLPGIPIAIHPTGAVGSHSKANIRSTDDAELDGMR